MSKPITPEEDPKEILKKTLRNLIANNKTEEALKLLSESQFTDLDRSIIGLNSRYSNLKEKEIMGTISDDVALLELNKINEAILDLSEALKDTKDRIINIQKTHPLKIVGTLAGLVAIVALLFYFFQKSPKEKALNPTIDGIISELAIENINLPINISQSLPIPFAAWTKAKGNTGVEVIEIEGLKYIRNSELELSYIEKPSSNDGIKYYGSWSVEKGKFPIEFLTINGRSKIEGQINGKSYFLDITDDFLGQTSNEEVLKFSIWQEPNLDYEQPDSFYENFPATYHRLIQEENWIDLEPMYTKKLGVFHAYRMPTNDSAMVEHRRFATKFELIDFSIDDTHLMKEDGQVTIEYDMLFYLINKSSNNPLCYDTKNTLNMIGKKITGVYQNQADRIPCDFEQSD